MSAWRHEFGFSKNVKKHPPPHSRPCLPLHLLQTFICEYIHFSLTYIWFLCSQFGQISIWKNTNLGVCLLSIWIKKQRPDKTELMRGKMSNKAKAFLCDLCLSRFIWARWAHPHPLNCANTHQYTLSSMLTYTCTFSYTKGLTAALMK